jgi:DNA-binding transcriptional LysR family regulator
MSIRSSNWELFAAYLAVCRTSSLSAAARSLGLSQPTVRRQIEALEAVVGTALFTRSAAGLDPLPGHQALMAEAEAIAVRLMRPEQAALVARKVSPMRLGFFATPDLAERVRGMDFEALSATGLMIGQDRLGTIAAGLRNFGLTPPARTVFRSDDDLAQLAAIRSGIGVGICQIAIGQRSGLVRVLEGIAPTFDAWVVMHEDQKRLARARVVFDALVAALDH